MRTLRPGVAATAGLVLGLCGSAAAQPAMVVTSGPLRATVTASPWNIAFSQAGGAAPRELAAAGTGSAGPLGFRTATGWVHGTRLLSEHTDGRALVAQVATDDPGGRGLAVRIAPAGGGVIAVSATVTGGVTADVSATGIGFAAPPSEHFYGFGERSTTVDQRGRDVEDYASDGPFPASNRPFVMGTIPPQGFRDRDDATYYPVPWLLSSRGYGFLLDNAQTSTFHLASATPAAWSVEAQAAALRFRVFSGPEPAGALRRFTAATGRQPPPATAWQFGPWFQTGQPNTVPLADEAAWLAKLRKADAPVSAAETQLRYLPCGLDRGNEDYEARRVAFFHSHGLAILTYVNPMVCSSYQPLFDDAAAAGALQRDAAGAPDTFNSFVGGIGPAGFAIVPVAEFDFTAPAGAATYSTVLKRIVAAGHDGWMEDFGEYTPTDTAPRDGTTAAEMHNLYPARYHCAVADLLAHGLAPRPVVRFQRSGWTGAARCASDVWGGDPTTTFGFDGLSSAVKEALSIGMSGVSRWGSDIGGYDTLGGDPQLTPELLKRWIELGAVSGVMRTKASGLAVPSYQRPEIWDPGIVATWRRYAKLHTQLYPYLLAADAAYRASGLPLMRALALTDPGDAHAAAAEDEFGFGPDLLAAPVVTAGATSRPVYLPRGHWLDWSRAIRYAPRDGSFHVAGGGVLRGGRVVRARAGIEQLPLYLRAGTILPLLAPDVSTLAGYGTGVVHLADRRGRLRLLAFPSTGRTGRAYARDRFVSRVRPGTWTLAVRGTAPRRYDLEAATAGLPSSRAGAPFRPCRIAVGGRRLARRAWSFDARRGVLAVRFRTRSGTLSVSDRCER